LRQLILGEVLDRAPNVTFADVADLATAKQALQEAVILPR
jgi:SpoVK/Ycf46/Vps4 family AAA+-type ATPase